MVKEVLSKENIKFHQMFPLIDDDYIWRTEEEEKAYHTKVRRNIMFVVFRFLIIGLLMKSMMN